MDGDPVCMQSSIAEQSAALTGCCDSRRRESQATYLSRASIEISGTREIICDYTGRNPNVLYEAGITHTLGREVILITQSAEDIPFDHRHLRYVHYLNNGEGLVQLSARIQQRLEALG